jgi:hypothetical protein
MLGNLDDDAGDDTWTLMMKDMEIASGGRYDRLSFTLSNGQMTDIKSENVLDLLDTHSAPLYPLADFDGLVSSDHFEKMISKSLSLEKRLFQNVFAQNKLSLIAKMESESFTDSLASHPMESASLFIGSIVFGMVSVFGVMKFFSPSLKQQNSYSTVMDTSSFASRVTTPTRPGREAGGGIQLEKPMGRNSAQELFL